MADTTPKRRASTSTLHQHCQRSSRDIDKIAGVSQSTESWSKSKHRMTCYKKVRGNKVIHLPSKKKMSNKANNSEKTMHIL